MSNERGRFCWYDLITPDPKGAVPFYTKVVGWGTTDWQAPDASTPPYTMWVNGETMLGGVMQQPEEEKADCLPPMWRVYIATPDIEATVWRAAELGGAVHQPPTVIPTVGRFADLADPQGSLFCVFQSDGDVPGSDGPRQVGEFSWHELATSDPDAAFAFYGDLFGWVRAGTVDMGRMGGYRMFGHDPDSPIGGIYHKPKGVPLPGWLPYVQVDDVRKAIERVQASGGKVFHGPSEIPGGDLIAHGSTLRARSSPCTPPPCNRARCDRDTQS